MSHPLFVLINLQCIIHKFQKIGSYYQVIFQYNNPSEVIDLCCYPIDDVACKSPVRFTFDNGYCFKSADTMNISAYLLYSGITFRVFALVGIDK